MKTDWNEVLQLLLNATGETLYMVLLAGLFTLLIGLPLGVLLFISRAGGLFPLPRLNRALGAVINLGRSLPFVVMLIALIPLTRLIVGTALDDVDKGRIEAIVAMGGDIRHVIFKVLLPEALPALVAGVTLTLVMLIGFSSMAGVIGGGGLGDLAIRYGYQRFNNQIMVVSVVVLVVLVPGVQSLGDRCVRSLAHRR